jgi:DNA-binding transcriptional MerR regulator
MHGVQIGKVAIQTGVSIDTIRFYELSGRLAKPARTEGR